jgi:hypothetical protein
VGQGGPQGYTISTSQTGFSFAIDSVSYATPQTRQWQSGEQHTVSAPSSQTDASGNLYDFSNWSDGGAQSHAVVGGVSPSFITANFIQHVPVPSGTSLIPNSGTGSTQAFTATYTYGNNPSGITKGLLLIGQTAGSTVGQCVMWYTPGTGLYLMADDGATHLGPIAAGGLDALSNSQCTLSGVSTANIFGNTLTVTFAVVFSTSFAGTKQLIVQAQSSISTGRANTLGTWTVPASTPAPTALLNVSGYSSASYQVGDSYTINVTGLPGLAVTVRQNGALALKGTTDASGVWSTAGTWTNADVGTYTQTWYVGGVPAVPALAFNVLPNPGPSIPNSFTAGANPLTCNDISGGWTDTLPPNNATWTLTWNGSALSSGSLQRTVYPECGVTTYQQISADGSTNTFTLTASQPVNEHSCSAVITSVLTETVKLSGNSCSVGTSQWQGSTPGTTGGSGSSSWQATTPHFIVQYSSYIPVDHIQGPTPCVSNGAPSLTQYLLYKGDKNRASYRTTQSILTIPDAAHSFGFYANTGATRNYSIGSPANGVFAGIDSNPVNPNDIYAGPYTGADEDGIRYDCRFWNDWGQSSTSQMQQYNIAYPSSTQVKVGLLGLGQDPLEPKFGGIQWSVAVTIDDSNPSAPSAYVNYAHTCYPAHNVKVNGFVVYDSQRDIGFPQQNTTGYLMNCLAFAPLVTGQTQPVAIPRQ